MKNIFRKFIFFIYLIFLFCTNCFSEIIFNSKEELINFGIKNSDSLNQSKQYAIEQMKNAKISIDSFLPKLQFSINEFDNINFNAPDNRTKSIEANICQPIFDNGKSILNYKFNKYSALLSYYDFNVNLQNYILLLSQKYYEYILQDKIIELKNELLESMNQKLKIIEYEYENGIALKSDLLEFTISHKEIQNQISKEKNLKENIYLDLQTLLSLEQNQNFKINFNDEKINFKNENLENKKTELEKSILKNSNSLKQKNASNSFQRTQYKMSKQFYFPTISLQGEISFSGKTFPLTQPNYSLKLIFSFENIPFFPSNFSNSFVLKDKKLSSFSDSFSTTLIPQIQYFSNQRLTKISLNKSETEKKDLIIELKKTIMQYIQEHDSKLDYIKLLEESIKLKEEKFVITEFQMNNGLVTSSDFIKEKINLSESKQLLVKEKINLLILQNQISILTGEKFL